MDRQLELHRMVEQELKRCQNLLNDFDREYPGLPKGSLQDRNGHPYKFVRENGKAFLTVLNDSEMQRKLKKRRYIQKGRILLQKRITNCNKFLKNDTFYDPIQIEKGLRPVYRNVNGLGIFLENDIDPGEWVSADYKRNPYEFEEDHFTAGGIRVRSKSEALIGTQMEAMGMMFRCEPELWLGNAVCYPDFCILLPNRRKVVYWEHFGRMDDADYVVRAMQKMDLYRRFGIPVIFTWETRSMPLNIKEINLKLEELLKMDA